MLHPLLHVGMTVGLNLNPNSNRDYHNFASTKDEYLATEYDGNFPAYSDSIPHGYALYIQQTAVGFIVGKKSWPYAEEFIVLLGSTCCVFLPHELIEI
jgi:hypothetical protein